MKFHPWVLYAPTEGGGATVEAGTGGDGGATSEEPGKSTPGIPEGFNKSEWENLLPAEREAFGITDEQIEVNLLGIRRVFSKYLTFGTGSTDAVMANRHLAAHCSDALVLDKSALDGVHLLFPSSLLR